MGYITQFYTWGTGNTITATRLNGNIVNLIEGLDSGTKDINIAKLQIAGTDVIDGSQNITVTGDISSTSSSTSKPLWLIKNTTAGATTGEFQFYKLSSSPADNDDIGNITFYGDDDGTNKTLFAQILVESTDVTGGTEDGKMTINTMTAGTSTATLTLESGDATFGGALTVTGAATFTGGTTFNGGITLGAGDDLIGSSTSDITFNTDKFTVAGATGNTVVAGTLGVTGVGTFTAQSVHNGGLTDGTATLDGSGAWTGIASLVVDDITINGNTISSAGASSLTITATAGQAVSIEGMSVDGGVVTGLSALTSTAITGTLQTAAQPNITSLGTLTGLTVDSSSITLSQDTNIVISGGLNGLSIDGTTFSVDGSNNRIGIGTAAPDATLHVHTDTAGSVTPNVGADNLVVEDSGTTGISILCPDANNAQIIFGTPTNNFSGIVRWDRTNDKFDIGGLDSGSDIDFYANNGVKMTLYASGGLVVGSPTGGDQGAGTINAQAVYDDGSILTDYVFEKYYTGKTIEKKHENYVMKSLDEEIDFSKNNLHLSTIVGRKEWEKNGKLSTGQLINQLWETVETQFIYISELKQKIDKLS